MKQHFLIFFLISCSALSYVKALGTQDEFDKIKQDVLLAYKNHQPPNQILKTNSGYAYFVYPGVGVGSYNCKAPTNIEVQCVDDTVKALDEVIKEDVAQKNDAKTAGRTPCSYPVIYVQCSKSANNPVKLDRKKAQSLCEEKNPYPRKGAHKLKSLKYRTESRAPDKNWDNEIIEDSSSSFLFPDVFSNPLLYGLRKNWKAQLSTWCSTFTSEKSYDQDPKTAWCEGADGDGLQEVLLADAGVLESLSKDEQKIEIWAGYGKSKEIFEANNRPRKVKILVVAELSFGNFTPDVYVLIPLKERIVELKDINGFQDISIPGFSDPVSRNPEAIDEKKRFGLKFKAKNSDKYLYENTPWISPRYLLAIQILSVYPGQKFKDTCISEIRIKKANGNPRTN